MLIGELINQIRGVFRLTSADNDLTDREVFALCKKHRSWLIKREAKKNKILTNAKVMTPNSCIELIDVDIAECCDISSFCMVKRSKDKLPEIMSDDSGPLIGFVSSLDKVVKVYPTTVGNWLNKKKSTVYKYDTNKYYWIYNDYIYSPNIEWDFLFMLAANEDPVDPCNLVETCAPMQSKRFNCPDYLIGELVSNVMKDLNPVVQLPSQEKVDKNENTK